jgi:hypothetical protein
MHKKSSVMKGKYAEMQDNIAIRSMKVLSDYDQTGQTLARFDLGRHLTAPPKNTARSL